MMNNDYFERSITDPESGRHFVLAFDFEVAGDCKIVVRQDHNVVNVVRLSATPDGFEVDVGNVTDVSFAADSDKWKEEDYAKESTER